MAMLSATDRSGISDSSWKMQAMPAALAAAGDWRSAPARLRAACGPRPAATTPAMILISVDLPAPFSPRMAWMRPASTVEVGILAAPCTPP